MYKPDIQELAFQLNERIEGEIAKYLNVQLAKFGETLEKVDPVKLKRVLYPEDPDILCVYKYEDRMILTVRWIDTGIMYEMPK